MLSESGEKFITETNMEGQYTFLNIQMGTYRIRPSNDIYFHPDHKQIECQIEQSNGR